MNKPIAGSAALLLAGLVVILGSVTGAASAGTGQDFSEHLRDCQQGMVFDGTMNPGMHQGFSGWSADHIC